MVHQLDLDPRLFTGDFRSSKPLEMQLIRSANTQTVQATWNESKDVIVYQNDCPAMLPH